MKDQVIGCGKDLLMARHSWMTGFMALLQVPLMHCRICFVLILTTILLYGPSTYVVYIWPTQMLLANSWRVLEASA